MQPMFFVEPKFRSNAIRIKTPPGQALFAFTDRLNSRSASERPLSATEGKPVGEKAFIVPDIAEGYGNSDGGVSGTIEITSYMVVAGRKGTP